LEIKVKHRFWSIDTYFNERFGDGRVPISKQGLSERRSYLNPTIFKDTDKYTLKDFYCLKQDDLEDFKGYYVFAIDGSHIRYS
jgi:hypothetical protein